MSLRTPYYVFDAALFSAMIHRYSAFGSVYFPIKANDHKLVIREVLKANCGFEVDSIEHMRRLVRAYDTSPEKIVYSYPIREDVDIRDATRLGVRLFVVDSVKEYERIATLSPTARFVVRVNVPSILKCTLPPGQDKWGLSLSDASALVSSIRANGRELAGVSFYVPAEIHRADAFISVLDAIASIFAGTTMEFVNIGGGVSIEMLEDIHRSLENTRKAVGAKRIVIEPGRHLLNPCIDMVVGVIAIRYISNNRIVFLNSGIYSGLLDAVLKSKKYTIVDEQQCGTSSLSIAYVCGSSSDVSDTLGEYRLRNDITVGDSLIIKECGAYSEVMQTHFCRKDHIHMTLKAAVSS